MKTISQYKAMIARKFRGASLDDVQGLSDFTIYGEAATNLLSVLDPIETIRMHRFDVFSDITEYAPPNDLKARKVIDPAPQDGEGDEDFRQIRTKEFRRDQQDYKVSVQFRDGSKVLNLRAPGEGSKLSVDTVSVLGSWSAAGGASGLAVDQNLSLDSSDSLRFDLGAAGGYVENAALTETDLSSHEDRSSFFRKIYIPSGSENITSISIRIGSASGAYWQITGQAQFGSYRDGVNLIRFDWDDATETGAPSSSAVDYERLTFVTAAAISNVRIGPLSSRLPLPYETPYYSNRLFKDSNGSWLEVPTSEDDIVQLEKDAENLFFYELCEIVANDLTLEDERLKYHVMLHGPTGSKNEGYYANYREDKPTEKLPATNRYINLSDRRGRRRIGRFGKRW